MDEQQTASQPQTGNEDHEEREVKPGRVDEYKTGKRDPFAVAFNAAKDDLEGESEPKPPAKAKPKEAEAPKTKPAPERESERQPPRASQKAKEADSEDTPDDEGEDETAVQGASKAVLEPRKYWSESRKQAFRFQNRETQAAWLEEEPAPNDRWPTEVKEQFSKLPREAKEVVLTQLGEADKGLNQKFQALAAERKLAEDIRSAVPPMMRGYMQQRGLSEPQVFAKLLDYQQQAMTDPVGYVRQFIMQNKIDPTQILGVEGGQSNGQGVNRQADISSHPAYQALKAQHDHLLHSIQQDRMQKEQHESRNLAAEMDGIMSETDGDGNSLFPFIRVLADPMARIIESDPELFGSMGVKDRFTTAYNLALQEYPELAAIQRTAKPKVADEQPHAAHSDEEERTAKLSRAITPKSKASPVATGAKSNGNLSLDDAIASARKQLKR